MIGVRAIEISINKMKKTDAQLTCDLKRVEKTQDENQQEMKKHFKEAVQSLLDRLPTFNVDGLIGHQEEAPFKNFPEFALSCYETTVAAKNNECSMAKTLQIDLEELMMKFNEQSLATKT